ncbi:MAG TPA: hypothetical protein VJ783_02890 [Pirellulales bacterium]|nr:hypothetical protein [Pirellulales bacterium]
MKTVATQLSLKGLFAIVTLLCALFAGLGVCVDLAREARRRSECLPGLRGGHPYWSTPEGQRALAAYSKWREVSVAERARRERATRLRVYVGELSFGVVVLLLAIRLVVFVCLNVRRRTVPETVAQGSEH